MLDKEAREKLDLLFKFLQLIVIFVGVGWTAFTFADTRYRELRKPFDEKQLVLYAEAGRVIAHLSMAPNVDKDKTEAEFWELFWGQLPLIESPEVTRLMEQFCTIAFGSRIECSKAEHNEMVESAKQVATAAKAEIQQRWCYEPPLLGMIRTVRNSACPQN
jgi:hypothetical protein